jgi:hypothetical protein
MLTAQRLGHCDDRFDDPGSIRTAYGDFTAFLRDHIGGVAHGSFGVEMLHVQWRPFGEQLLLPRYG